MTAQKPQQPTNKEANEAFLKAFKARDYDAAEAALKAGADVDYQSEDVDEYGYKQNTGYSAMHIATQDNDYDAVEWLLQHKASPDTMIGASTPLLRAVDKATNEYRTNPEEKKQGYRIVRLLLDNGADPNFPAEVKSHVKPRQFALHRAAAVGNEPMFHLLVKHGADVNLVSHDGTTALWQAASANRHRLSCLLVNAGADPNGIEDNQGYYGSISGTSRSSLHYISPRHAGDATAVAAKTRLLRALLDGGADVFAKDNKGQTPREAMLAVSGGKGEGIAKIYEEYEKYAQFTEQDIAGLRRRDLFTVDVNGNTLLDSPATWKHFAAITEHLTSLGDPLRPEDLQDRNRDGKTWLERGAECFAIKDIIAYVAPTKKAHSVSKALGITPRGQEENYQWSDAPTALQAVASRMQLSELFEPDLWKGRSQDELRAVYNALPELGRADVDNFQQLLLRLPRQRPTPGGNKGVGRYERGGEGGIGM